MRLYLNEYEAESVLEWLTRDPFRPPASVNVDRLLAVQNVINKLEKLLTSTSRFSNNNLHSQTG